MSREELKVAVLYDMWEDVEPAPEPEEPPPPPRARGKKKPVRRRKKKEKPDREEVFDALGKLGHEPSYLVLDGRPQTLAAVARCDADLFFNLTESYAGA